MATEPVFGLGVVILSPKTVLFTVAAWFMGLFLDANIDFGDPKGFLCLRVLFPVLAMGLCLLKAVHTKKDGQDKQE